MLVLQWAFQAQTLPKPPLRLFSLVRSNQLYQRLVLQLQLLTTDDNFDTITRAVEEGRVIYENILKFILYLLSCNSAEILIVLISIIVGLESPFTTIQILWANIIGSHSTPHHYSLTDQFIHFS